MTFTEFIDFSQQGLEHFLTKTPQAPFGQAHGYQFIEGCSVEQSEYSLSLKIKYSPNGIVRQRRVVAQFTLEYFIDESGTLSPKWTFKELELGPIL